MEIKKQRRRNNGFQNRKKNQITSTISPIITYNRSYGCVRNFLITKKYIF